jgi:hypothetical protein
MGGPVAERAEITDKNPPQLVKYDRWGHDISEVTIAESAKATKRDLVERGFMGPKFRRDAEAAGVNSGPLSLANGYMLQAESGCPARWGRAGMVESQVRSLHADDAAARALAAGVGQWIGGRGSSSGRRSSDSAAWDDSDPQGAQLLTASSGSPQPGRQAFVVLAKRRRAGRGEGNTVPRAEKHRRDGTATR